MNRIEALKYYKIGRNLSQGSKESQHYFDLSIKSDNTFSYAYFEKSVPFNKRGDYAKGFELLNKAVELNPRMHLGYRGWLRLVKLKDYNGCINDLKELQKIKSENTYNAWGQNINYLIGISFLGLKTFDKAIKCLDIAINENGNLNHYFSKAITLLRIEDFERSIKLLKICINQNCNFTEAYYYLGLNYSKTEELNKAENNFNKALKLYKQGFKNRNPYNEVFMEIYLFDFEIAIATLI
ncbi:tetratricopeptide repeat protein [Cellulophaga omnivescoria]|uniref:tetratricopeptide repeat protein n=1 Tax=Cellulophaga omnivescoria TaxID=1888890 RepID=UPI000986FFF4|nr:tetratricopeptide repeat protein [Cellulophaga omnivescoria]